MIEQSPCVKFAGPSLMDTSVLQRRERIVSDHVDKASRSIPTFTIFGSKRLAPGGSQILAKISHDRFNVAAVSEHKFLL